MNISTNENVKYFQFNIFVLEEVCLMSGSDPDKNITLKDVIFYLSHRDYDVRFVNNHLIFLEKKGFVEILTRTPTSPINYKLVNEVKITKNGIHVVNCLMNEIYYGYNFWSQFPSVVQIEYELSLEFKEMIKYAERLLGFLK